MTPQRLGELARRWRRTLLARELGFAVGAAGLAAVLVAAWPGRTAGAWLLPLAVLAGTLAVRTAASPWRGLDAVRLARHLDRVHPELEESSRLWLRAPGELTLLERLQLQRINAAAVPGGPGGADFGRPPRGFLRLSAVCGTLGALLLAVAAFQTVHHPAAGHRATLTTSVAGPATASSPPPMVAPAWPKLTGGSLKITPPTYTGHPARQVDGLGAAEIEEGATVTWSVALDRPVRDARLVFGDAAPDTRPLTPGPDTRHLTASRTITETGLYHLAATLPDGRVWNPPDLYSLRVLKDRPPTVRIVRPEQPRTVIDPPPEGQPAPRVEVEVAAGDDYGVGEAHLVATVARGSGEAVKFHEQTFPFDTDTPDPASPRGRTFRRTLDFGALGLEPGDELYFFVEVLDNRQPAANHTRSETRFLVLRGPEETAPSTGKGVAGVNLVPQYFRSERQIIIDTEKLITDRPHLSDHELRQRSNDLGGDQQLLRLRYGQFLGEDMEEGLGDHTEVNLDPLQATPEQNAGPHAAASLTMRFLQEHEEQDREGGSDEQRAASARPAPETPLPAAQVVAPYVDQHDSQDKATFFDHETKGTMRDALDAMWKAERHLRVMQLDDALAPEHQALEILKDLQQSARAYVQHVGFEPPPLKVAQRRLKGDVTDVPPRAAQADPLPPDDPALGAVRAAVANLPWHRLPLAALTGEETDLLRQVQPALTQAATRQPEAFLDGLQALRQRLASSADAGPLPPALEQALLRLLPPAGPLPERSADASPSLARAYADALQNDPAAGGTP